MSSFYYCQTKCQLQPAFSLFMSEGKRIAPRTYSNNFEVGAHFAIIFRSTATCNMTELYTII